MAKPAAAAAAIPSTFLVAEPPPRYVIELPVLSAWRPDRLSPKALSFFFIQLAG